MICLLLNALDDRGFRGSGVVEDQKDKEVQQLHRDRSKHEIGVWLPPMTEMAIM